MLDKGQRIEIFWQTVELCRKDKLLAQGVKEALQGQRIFWEQEELPAPGKPRYEKTQRIFSAKPTLEAARTHAQAGKKTCVLNFASFVNPGGGVESGSTSQEESLCRVSSLYPLLSDGASVGEFYRRHQELARSGSTNWRNSDDLIFTPGVAVVRRDSPDCPLLPPQQRYSVDVISCTAPDLRQHGGAKPNPGPELLFQVIRQRMERIVRVAAWSGAQVLILGAFGCGTFQNPPEVVANACARVLQKYEGQFEIVEFAVYSQDPDSPNHKAFQNIPGIQQELQPIPEELLQHTINQTYRDLQVFVRDADLPQRLHSRYTPGQILREKAFVDASSQLGGMATGHRYVILSNHMLNAELLSPESGWGLHIAGKDSRFRVLGVRQFGQRTITFLLHLPMDDTWRVFKQLQLSLDGQLLQQAVEQQEQCLAQPPVEALQDPAWLDRCRFPLGMDDQGTLWPLD